ncbi:MAG: SDR family oxidoreductase [Chloroflexi bacterium]|nr:SDR family oxidoreductase [Chloroflexota bacterium]
MIDPGLAERVVLITGANHGIGAATARAFAAQACRVFIAYYRAPCPYSPEELAQAREAGIGGDILYRAHQEQSPEPLVDEIRSRGGIATAFEMDLADPENIPRLFDHCEIELGPVEILVANHTHCTPETFDPALVTGRVHLTSAEGIDLHFAINARACALLMVEYLKRHLARGSTWGRIINLSTDAAHAHVANVSYAASKHAIESYSRSAAVELGKYGITINVVAPGPIQTGYIIPEVEDEIARDTPLRRVGQPDDVADVIVFLASHQARWLTGQLLYTGGGWRIPQ